MHFATFAKVILLGCALAATMTSGVNGRVHISPAHPGPQRIGESGSAPMHGATVQVLDASRHVVARVVTDADGRFSVALPAGDYSLEVDVGNAALPRCGAAQVTVRDGHVEDAELECDSGMR
jgi:hypothetical protein